MSLNNYRRCALLCAALLAASTLGGCWLFPKKFEALKVDTGFSCNILRPESNWPGQYYEPSPAQIHA